ncbi:hypothetical protein POPTR_015G050601v4 [Populus trichocarpa]|uniref:Uncharacterized protein n=1 Tax=Populus trichocarpa TaxID=3694 RepID=A0ACC0RVN3_POPTR|nr:hypothetical protein BDE02_15G044600 [Populus trichocarpa]KAI9381078.1 hypothetical protein POPTR_015G050601v4 [Populus trichocarpa]
MNFKERSIQSGTRLLKCKYNRSSRSFSFPSGVVS